MSTPASRWKALPWLLGACVAVGTLIAASRLVGTADAQTPGADKGKPAKPAEGGGSGGLTILGTVDAPLGVLRVDPPAVAGVLSVKEILVEEGKVVAVGDPLIQFDDAVFQHGLAQAKAALTEAKWTQAKAIAGRNDHKKLLEKQQLAVDAAKIRWDRAKESRDRGNDVFERVLSTETNTVGGRNLTDEEKTRRRKENQDLIKAETMVELAEKDHEKELIDQARLTASPIDADPNRAAADVERLTAKVAEVKAMVDACRVTAKVAGTVEQVLATPGMLFGPGTRIPAMQIVPSGERIVRAEVDAEFVAKVADKTGRKVTITDAHHFNHTYEGVVVRVGTSLLPKRGGGEILTGPPAKVLECRIKITDPTPPGRPPLLVGQPVRVVMGP